MTFAEAVSQIKERSTVEIIDLVSERISLQKSGSYYKSCCPFHDEKTPSFYVSEIKGTYKCFGCGVWGDAIDFISWYDGLTFTEVIYLLADRYHLSISNKSRLNYQQTLKKENEIIPGFSNIKAQISKSGKLYLAFNQSNVPFNPLLFIEDTLSHEAATLLRKRTLRIVLVAEQIQWNVLKTSIETALSAGLEVFVIPDYSNKLQEVDWIEYCLSHSSPDMERNEIIKLIAKIPDNITRSCYVTYFTENLTEIIP